MPPEHVNQLQILAKKKPYADNPWGLQMTEHGRSRPKRTGRNSNATVKIGNTRFSSPKRAIVWLFALSVSALIVFQGTSNLTSKADTNQVSDDGPKKGKTLISYAYTDCGEICRRNLQYFCRVAISETPSYDFIIISNGPCPTCKSDADIAKTLSLSNVEFLERENKGFDFGAYSHGLEKMEWDKYAYFIFLNAGIRGPLVTARELQNIRQWPEMFLSRLSDKVKMVGPVISCERHVHMPSILFAIEKATVKLFMSKNIFTREAQSIDQLVTESEVFMSKLLFDEGYTIDCLMLQYQGVDWRKIYNETGGSMVYNCNRAKNPMVMNWYGSSKLYDLNHLETVFVKRGGSTRSVCPNNVCSFDAPIDDTSTWIERYLGYPV
jgi:hypothetical protein